MTVSSLDVEAGVEVLLSGVVEALDAVRLRVVRHQLRVLLDHQQEASLTLGTNSGLEYVGNIIADFWNFGFLIMGF